MNMATGSPLPTFLSLPLPIIQLSLPAVLKCGQSFRWSLVPVAGDTEYRLCLRDRVVCLRQSPTNLLYRAMFPDPQPSPTEKALKDKETLAWLNDYFQLDVDLAALYKQWSEQDQVFARVQHRFQGIRILRQDPWENLVSFICSSNNNISRITRMVEALCSHYSPSLLSFPGEETAYHPFPPPSVLAQPGVSATLRSLGFGYRADFINRTAKALVDTHGKISSESLEASEKWLLKLRDSNTESARKELLQFTGVGRKVADCVLLMSLDKKEVVPVDTHVLQIAVNHYGLKGAPKLGQKKINMTPKLYDDVNRKFLSLWGNYAGWAHSVLFTADLKSFSSYGLPTLESSGPSLQTPTNIPVSLEEHATEELKVAISEQYESGPAERVKKRRRMV